MVHLIQRRRWIFFLLAVGAAALVIFTRLNLQGKPADRPPDRISDYAIASQSAFNDPTSFPIQQSVDPSLYRSVGEWQGRLILPDISERQDGTDWVWFEVWQTPLAHRELIGRKVKLTWNDNPELRAYLQAVTKDVNFTGDAIEGQRTGNIHPTRLDRQQQVGALRSLVGVRHKDDMVVTLEQVTVRVEAGQPLLQISQEPMQIAGRFYALVQILSPVAGGEIPAQCPEAQPCSSSLMRVRHYNPATQQFDGMEEVVQIPQVLAGRDGVFQSTPRQLERSPAGGQGWYIYGAKDRQGRFVVQAIAPRSLLRLQPDEILFGEEAGINFLKQRSWHKMPDRKGTLQKVLLDPSEESTETALSQWKEGDRALVLHLFGGIGGKLAEPIAVPGTVTGHFGYGWAEVIRDPFTQALRFEIRYQQVYAHNPNGIVAGTLTWAEYMGSLQRGWLGTRPVSDTLIKFDPVLLDYNFDGTVLSPVRELQQQLNITIAHYRIGDGTGAALVKPALSCVQDASQAVFRTIKRIEQQVRDSTTIQTWLRSHPDDPQTLRFQQLVDLGRAIERELAPLGIVRADWQQNSDILVGIKRQQNFAREDSLWTQLLSWRTVLPRVAHDRIAMLFLERGAKVWVLRTNQVGGWNPDILPLAPTQLLEQYHIIPYTFSRLFEAFGAMLSFKDWLLTLGILTIYGAIALPIGFYTKFIHWDIAYLISLNWLRRAGFALKVFLVPGISEEVLFRIWLLPHPTEGVSLSVWLTWAAFSLIAFVVYHPFEAVTYFRAGNPTFFHPVFLSLAALLGVACTVVYKLTGSLWAIAFVHWAIVFVWLLFLGGASALMHPNRSDRQT
ncbi:type II CAAX prenyl endopeptidase Rce1 family protein [Tumidithrix helvetica PCC 7403]|uniref:CPBP family glutamic-type intramembrane protease n=1 Tax=Tumidithrix helvetica TaxID=3457545 RepID=UPI003C865AB5